MQSHAFLEESAVHGLLSHMHASKGLLLPENLTPFPVMHTDGAAAVGWAKGWPAQDIAHVTG